ncbi:MAG: LysE family translocator, partial [Alphaproteobacteria bacterium]
MHVLWLIFQGLMVGFVMSTPPGPVAFFCIKKALQKTTQKEAWIAAFGASLADVFLSFAAACGMGFFHIFFETHAIELRIGGSLLVIGIGCFLLLSKPRPEKTTPSSLTKGTVFSFSFFVTLLNPFAFMAFAAIFSTLHLENLEAYASLLPLVGGVFIGATFWWSFLIFLSTRGQTYFNFYLEKTWLIHKGTGGVLCFLGISTLFYSFI